MVPQIATAKIVHGNVTPTATIGGVPTSPTMALVSPGGIPPATGRTGVLAVLHVRIPMLLGEQELAAGMFPGVVAALFNRLGASD